MRNLPCLYRQLSSCRRLLRRSHKDAWREGWWASEKEYAWRALKNEDNSFAGTSVLWQGRGAAGRGGRSKLVKTRFSEKCFNWAERGRAAFAEAQGKGRDSRGGITFPGLQHLWVYQVVCVGGVPSKWRKSWQGEQNRIHGTFPGFLSLCKLSESGNWGWLKGIHQPAYAQRESPANLQEVGQAPDPLWLWKSLISAPALFPQRHRYPACTDGLERLKYRNIRQKVCKI